MPGQIQVANLAEEVTSAVLTAVERHEKLGAIIDSENGMLVFHPMITMGGLIAIARGEIQQLGQLERQV